MGYRGVLAMGFFGKLSKWVKGMMPNSARDKPREHMGLGGRDKLADDIQRIIDMGCAINRDRVDSNPPNDEHDDGRDDNMKAIWKKVEAKVGGVMWIQVEDGEKMPAKYLLEDLFKECKRREMLLVVTKGAGLKICSDISKLDDEILKQMGLLRHNFELIDAVVEKLCTEDEK